MVCADGHDCVGMLAFRIWHVDRQTAERTGSDRANPSLTPIVRIILESGILNAAYLFAYVMTLNFGSQGLEIMSEMVSGYFCHGPPPFPLLPGNERSAHAGRDRRRR